MKFFVDTADVDAIRDLADTGLIDGVTTNPSLIAKSGRNFVELVSEICEIIDGPISAEVTATSYSDMLKEGRKLAKIHKNIAVKVPLTRDGLKACRALSLDGTMVNVTLCFSANQALLAAKVGATFVSPFVGRLDDIATDGMQLIEDIVDIYANYPDLKTDVLVASIRSPMHVLEAARIGAGVATLPPEVLSAMFNHPLTDKGLATFLSDWQKTGQSII